MVIMLAIVINHSEHGGNKDYELIKVSPQRNGEEGYSECETKLKIHMTINKDDCDYFQGSIFTISSKWKID